MLSLLFVLLLSIFIVFTTICTTIFIIIFIITVMYAFIGEYPAVIAAWCLTLEYGISGSAVARSWGDKVNAYISATMISHQMGSTINNMNNTGNSYSNNYSNNYDSNDNSSNINLFSIFSPGLGINIFAGLLQITVVIILLLGVDIGKIAVNSFTVIKVILVLYMIICGLVLFQPANLEVGFLPMGVDGILRGATSCFFGYIGYDEVSGNRNKKIEL